MADTKVICNREDLVAIADAVRDKTGSNNEMTLEDITNNVSRIQTSENALTLEEKSVTITENGTSNVMPSIGSAFSKVNITVEVPIPDGYVKPTITIDATEYTPGTTNQTIASGTYCSGVQTILGDSNLIADNIAEGVSIFGVVGTHSGGEIGPDYYNIYQRVEYIESAVEGTYPYIITDYYANNHTGVEVIASFPVLQDRIPMGSRENSDATRFYCCYPLSSTGSYYGFNSGSSLSGSFDINTKYRCQTNFLGSRMAGIFDFNGNRKSGGLISTTLTTQTAPISIFGYNSASSGAVSSKREFKLYGAKISQGFEVVREYIPCCRKSDGVVGVYEKFTGQFLTAETGAFAKGADIEW